MKKNYSAKLLTLLALWSLIGAPTWMLTQAQVGCVIPGATTVVVSANWSPLAADTGKIYDAQCTSACTVTLPSTPPTAVWRIALFVSGSAQVTINPNGLQVDGNTANEIVGNGVSLVISTDGTNYYTTGRGALAVIPNASSTGTTLYTLTKLTAAPSTAVIAATTDLTGSVGITVGNAGTSGYALIQTSGNVPCVFDGATTANDWVQYSSSTAGNCHDTGSTTRPTSGSDVLGRVLSTNGAGGTYTMNLLGPGNPAAIGGTNLGSLTYTASGTTTFAAASIWTVFAKVTATHSTSTTFSPTGLVSGGSYVVEIIQDGTGGGVTFTLGTAGSCSAWKVGGGGAGAITLSTAANAIDVLSFMFDGTNCVANFRTNFN